MKEEKMKAHMQAVLFDFDYRLADSSRGAVECINFALNALDQPSVSFDVACQTIGLSLDATFCSLTTPQWPNRVNLLASFKRGQIKSWQI